MASAREPRERDLEGETVLITAGPTQEPLDPVRFISNRSSGKMGYALAEAAARAGRAGDSGRRARAAARSRAACTVIHVQTARGDARGRVGASAPSRPSSSKPPPSPIITLPTCPQQKIKKTATRMSLELDPTPDILAELGQQEGRPAADRLRRRNRKSDRRSAPQAGIEELRHGGRQPGGRRRAPASNPTRTKWCWCCARAKRSRCARAPKREIADAIFDQVLKLRLRCTRCANDERRTCGSTWSSTRTWESRPIIEAPQRRVPAAASSTPP